MSVTIETTTPSWMKTGAAANTALKQEEFKRAQSAAASNKMRRFRMKAGEEAIITFLDGHIDKEGVLQAGVCYHEHTLQVGARWDNFICVGETELCPICADGGRSDFVGAFTIINHTPYVIKNGPNAGKTVVNQRQLVIAKVNSLKKFQTLATKRGGLVGWRVEVSRTTDKDASIGDMFQFLEYTDPDALTIRHGDDAKPADYGKELTYLTAKQLIEAGVGKAPMGLGLSKHGGSITDEDISDKM